jgi:hypothetical protein
MRYRFSALICFIVLYVFVSAQEEYLAPLQANMKLYYQTEAYRENTRSTFAYRNFIFKTDTLQIPFVDDFSRNTLRPFEVNPSDITDTLHFATGECIVNSDFDYFTLGFHFDSSYLYTFDINSGTVDSVAQQPVTIYIFDGADCFPLPSDSVKLWLSYYRYTSDDFDPLTGEKLDSTLVEADTLISIASLYFANLSPAANWIDNYAFWNTTFPILPISIGVATLDGLNEFGLPYNNNIVNAFGDADVLTSKPIDLSGLTNDSSVYLSFFYQMQGLGDFPDVNDSLVVEFKNEFDNSWVKVWAISSNQVSREDFVQVYIEVRDTNLIAGPKYFYPDFQFRFRNKASISGNNDHWHIDYVRLDKGRSLQDIDTIIRDVTLIYDFPNYLKNYTMLPWKQFQAGADEFVNNISVPIRDNGQVAGIQAGAFPLNVYITNSENTDTIFTEQGANFNPTEIIRSQTFFPSAEFSFPSFEAEDVCLQNLLYISPTDRNVLQQNDTIYNEICFNNVMAYDDGTAERAYGVQGGNPNEVKKFAYEFNVATPDTLAAIQIHFSNIDVNVSNLVFSLYVWDSIEFNSILPYENIIGTIENKRPVYIDKRNGFATFVFDTAITVSGKFYVGWAQVDNRNLQIGYDLNSTRGREHMYLFLNNQWRASTINTPGSPMLRIILDGSFPLDTPLVSSVNKIVPEPLQINVYPNPANDLLHVDIPTEISDFSIIAYDYAGKSVYAGYNQKTMDVSYLQAGLYILQIRDLKTGKQYFSRFLKVK